YYTYVRAVQNTVQGFANLANNAQQNAWEMARRQQEWQQKQFQAKMKEMPFPAPPAGNDPARDRSRNNLKQIAMAFHKFADVYGRLPYAAGDGKAGKGQLSWRVALLPFLEQEPLYREFRLNEAWDSPHNKRLLARMPEVYRPVQGFPPPSSTYYQVFTG